MPKVTMPKDHPQAAVDLLNGATVERGKSAEVDDDTAFSLGEQGWTVAPDKKAAPVKAAAKKSAKAAKKSANTEAPKGDPQPASPDAEPKES